MTELNLILGIVNAFCAIYNYRKERYGLCALCSIAATLCILNFIENTL